MSHPLDSMTKADQWKFKEAAEVLVHLCRKHGLTNFTALVKTLSGKTYALALMAGDDEMEGDDE